MDDYNKRMHEHALGQAAKHGKKILPADSTKDESFVAAGAIATAVAVSLLFRMFHVHIHGEILALLIAVGSLFIGGVLGHGVFDWIFVKDYSWQPPVMGQSWDAYRTEVKRWMGR